MWAFKYVVILMVVALFLLNTNGIEAFKTDENKCKKKTKKSDFDKYWWKQRELTSNGNWRCPQGWEDTGCDWGMGKDSESKQCRFKKIDRADSEEDNNTCKSNADCSEGRVCGYTGICFDKGSYLIENESGGKCKRNSHCAQGRTCKNKVSGVGMCTSDENAPADPAPSAPTSDLDALSDLNDAVAALAALNKNKSKGAVCTTHGECSSNKCTPKGNIKVCG